MNKSLRQLFTVVLILFVILGGSTSIIMAIRANEFNADPRNSRALYYEYGTPRGAILASDGTIIAESVPVNDAFSYQRQYTEGSVYAPITGYFSISQRADRGLEASRSELLSGQADQLFWQRFKSTLTGETNEGASIETSIDPNLQKTAYSALGSNDGAAIVMEIDTGRILAMASTPSYDPNELAGHDTAEVNDNYAQLTSDPTNPMLNRALSQLYPPGSTFKTVVAAAALESGDYDVDTQIPAGSSYTLPGTNTALTNAVSSADGTNGTISLEDALAYSSNTAFAQLGVALGEQKIADMAEKLGYGTAITVDGNNSTGLPMMAVASQFPSDMTDDKLALASIGQGDMQSTVLQNVMIAAAIANDGVLMAPTLVDCVRASDLSVISQTRPKVMSQAFSADTADKLTQMMESVVTKENQNLAISGVQVAAKTGTAQIGENNESIDGWVIGFAPADNPKYAVSVLVHNVDLYGSFAAGPIMKALLEEAMAE